MFIGHISDDGMSHCLPLMASISLGAALLGEKHRRGRTGTIMKGAPNERRASTSSLLGSGARQGCASLPKFRWTDLHLGGTSVPGILAAGRFWMASPHCWVFLDLRRSSKEVLVLKLQNYRYDAVMVEVDDVAGVLKIAREAKEEQRGAGWAGGVQPIGTGTQRPRHFPGTP